MLDLAATGAVASTAPSAPTTTAAAASDAVASAPACVPMSDAADPKSLVGFISSRAGSENLPGRFQATVVSVGVEPERDTLVAWKVSFKENGGRTHNENGGRTHNENGGRTHNENGGRTHHIRIVAPKSVTPPLVAGQRVSGSIGGVGGGPNRFFDVLFVAADGSLLLAINRAADGWQVERGKPSGGLEAMNGYTQRAYGVHFVGPDGKPVDVKAGSWARTEVGGCGYLLWGSAAERTLPPGKMAPRDYVGGWVDFAIVRAVGAQPR